jgi:tetratricopeptide (TPR) repeat protein
VGDPSLFIAPSPAWQDRQFAIRMREMFQTGQAAQSVAQLQTFVTSHANPYESTTLLLDILCEQENAVAAQQVLQQASFLPAVEQTYYVAKIALLTGNNAEAIGILESALPEAENHERYRALLAGLYQRTGMNEEAASHYRRLLNVFGEKPAYWLGFALAQDALNQSQLAVQAYQRVNQYSDLQPQVRQYIEQRLQVLQQ